MLPKCRMASCLDHTVSKSRLQFIWASRVYSLWNVWSLYLGRGLRAIFGTSQGLEGYSIEVKVERTKASSIAHSALQISGFEVVKFCGT